MKVSIWVIVSILLLPLLVMAQSKGGRWQFENNGDDTADWDISNNGGLLQNGAVYSTVPNPVQGFAHLWLDSSAADDYFIVADDADLDFNNEDIGISAWVYPQVLNDVHYLVNKGQQNSNPKTTNYALRISNGLPRLEFLVRDNNNQAHRVTSSFSIQPGQWNFVAAFYDFSQQVVYLWNDPAAAPADTFSFSQPLISNDAPLSIGAWYTDDPNSSSVKEFQGGMDDVRISGRIIDIIPETTGIENMNQKPLTADSRLSVFPNPFSLSAGQTRLNLNIESETTGEIQLAIYNVLGQCVFSEIFSAGSGMTIRRQVPASLFNKAAGLYFVSLTAGEKIVFSKLLLLN